MSGPIRGVIAALLTPRKPGGEVDARAIANNTRFVMEAGADGVCILGATGEYPAVSPADREVIFAAAREALGNRGLLLCGAGSCSLDESVRLANWVLGQGADYVLLPPPHFFPYSHDDVAEFFREAARQIRGPVLLYNIPSFTSPIDPVTAAVLMDAGGVAGIKDSSGDLTSLRLVREQYGDARSAIVGHDGVLARALRNRFCHAVVSGVAGVCPELLIELFHAGVSGRTADLDRCEYQLAALIGTLDDLPTPWGLKWIAEHRGFYPACHAVPLSSGRRQQREELNAWLTEWLPGVVDSAPGARTGRP